jgi:ADP-ribose pyrophosphatase YjhB (NUDIX family)
MSDKRYAGVIVKYGDKFLLCKRGSECEFEGTWSIPGGKIEKNEESLDAARREFLEETDIDISSENLSFIGVIPRTNRDGKKLKGYMYIYLMVVENKIHPDLEYAQDGHEHTECGYFDKSEMKKMNVDNFLEKVIKNLIGELFLYNFIYLYLF